MSVSRVRALVDPNRPWMALVEVEREEVVLGAFQRAASALDLGEASARGLTVTRRISGGPAVLAGPGTLHLVVALPSPSALVPCDASRLVNRHVRPLLRALASVGASAHFFGRDWISVAHRPASWVGFAHHAATGACIFEAFVAVSHAFALPRALDGYPERAADPFLGKAPAILSTRLESTREAILRAYDAAYGGGLALPSHLEGDLRPLANDVRPPWEMLVEEAIGFVGAGLSPTGTVEIGGDLMASDDLPEALGAALASLRQSPSEVRVTQAVERVFAGGPFVMDGVGDRASLVRVALSALTGGRTPPSR